ncbi:MAG: chromate transporter, partial [Clostridia bacterium]
LFAIFFKIGLFSFGGGYAMITLIENEVVNKRKWLTHSEIADMFAIAESTPGAIAINLATFVGAKQCGVLGGILATFGVVLPSFAIIVALSYVLNLVENNRWVGYLFAGIRIGVLVLILRAVISFFKDMRKNVFSAFLMLAAFLIAFLTNVSVIYIILGSIILSSLVVGFSAYRNKIYFFSSGTDQYINERVGKPLLKDEYFNERFFVENKALHTILPIQNKNVDGTSTLNKGEVQILNSETSTTNKGEVLILNSETSTANKGEVLILNCKPQPTGEGETTTLNSETTTAEKNEIHTKKSETSTANKEDKI